MVGWGEGGRHNTLKAFICTILALICIYYLYSNFKKILLGTSFISEQLHGVVFPILPVRKLKHQTP